MRIQTFVVLLVAAVCMSQTLERQTCSLVKSTVGVEMTNANAVIGGLFEIRNPILGGYGCGVPHKELMQVYEAARWALQKVNSNNMIPGIKIGMKAYDTCSSEVLAVKYAQDFYTRLVTGQNACVQNSSMLSLGFLGPLSSWTSTKVAEMTSRLPVSVLSPRAMSPTLSDTTMYPYFLRTSPSSRAQMKAILTLLNEMQWKRVTVVYTGSVYGNAAHNSVVEQAFKSGICITKSVLIPDGAQLPDYVSKLTDLPKYDSDVAIFLGSAVQSLQMFNALESMSLTLPDIKSIQWIMTDANLMLEKYPNRAKGLITVLPRSTMVTEFTDYFSNLNPSVSHLENPWFANWYMTQYDCKLPGVNYSPYSSYTDCVSQTAAQRSNDFRQNSYVSRTIMAVFTYAKALGNAHQARCGSSSGVCLSLQSMTTTDFHQYLKDVDFQFSASDNVPSLNGKRVAFDENGDFIEEDFTVWNYNDKSSSLDFQEVGNYVNGILTLSKSEIRLYNNDRNIRLSNLPVSPCPSAGCGNCVIPRDMVEFLYMPGDLVIGNVLSGHRGGSEPLSCGEVDPDEMMAAVAFYYAIQTAKSKMPGILNGVSLGGLVVDICKDAYAGTLLLNNIFGELHVVRDKKGRIVDRNAIKIMNERLGSPDTITFSQAMRAFNVQELGIFATSSTLSDKTKFPNYARVVPSDDKQAVALTQFFTREGWKFIQTINSPTNYGRTAVSDLRRISALADICVAASYEVDTDGTITDILSKIREQDQARVVVLFVNTKSEVLEAMKVISWPKDYIFVGTDSWTGQLFEGHMEFAPGFISFQPQYFSIAAFETWANSINPRQASAIPGFSEWYESVHQCYIDAENRGTYATACGSSSITSSPRYSYDRFIAYTINAAYMSAMALDSVLQSVCGQNYNGVCSKFRANMDVDEKIRSVFNNITLMTEYGRQFQVIGMESLQGYDILNYQAGAGFVQVAQFNTPQGRLSDLVRQDVKLPPGLHSSNFSSTCTGRCAQCTYVYNPGTYRHIPGDIEIGGLFGIHDVSKTNPYICGELRTVNGFQFSAAMMYAINQINSKSAPIDLKNVKLGGLILDHCNVESRRFDVLSSLYSGMLPVTETDTIDVAKVRAWVTDNSRSVIEVNEVVKPLNVPLISSMASGSEFVNKDIYPTFFRTIQGDVTLSVAMAKLAKALNFRYVTVLYSDDEYGQSGQDTFASISSQENVCIVSSYKIGSTSNMTQIVSTIASSDVNVVILWTSGTHTAQFYQERAKIYTSSNIVVIAPMPFMDIARSHGQNGGKSFFLNIKTTVITKYMEFIRNLPSTDSIKTDPFLMEYYMKILGCDLPNYYTHGVACSSIQTVAAWSAAIQQDNYVIPTINAVYSFAAALDVTLQDKCGSDYKDVCSNFLNTDKINDVIMQKMETLTFKDPSDFNFRFIDREGNTGMDLIYFDGGALRTVGEFAGASLQISDSRMSTLFPGTKSSCASPCTACINNQMDFSYIPGDILIGGVFDVHNKDVSSFSCADIKTLHGFQLLEAFHYAITKVNDKSGQFANILKDIKLGGIGLDACESAIRSGYTVSDIHNGLISLKKNGDTIDPDDISAYIAGYSSDSSLYLARILKSLKIPQISYASTSIALSDKERYPYFMRSVPADNNLAEGLVRFLDNYDIRYVQVVFSPNNYGRLGSMAFQNLADKNKICIGQMIQFPDNGTATSESSNEVVSAILKKPTANTIILFANTEYINSLFQAIRRNPSAVGKFNFLGTETWGNNLDVIAGVEDLAKDAVTWSLESTDIGDFDTYLSTKSPGNYPQNPWFPEFYEDMVDCYLTVPDGVHPVQCSSLSQVVISQRNYIQDPGILHVINSVYAAAIGIDAALKSVCGQNYTTVCEKFRNDANRRDILMNKILESKFVDPSGSQFNFTTNRDGNIGYQMFSINTRMEGDKLAYYYKKIGTYSNDKKLTTENYTPQWDGSCTRADACSECPTLRYGGVRYMYDESTNPQSNAQAATLVALLPVHFQGSDPYRCGRMNIEDFYRGLAFFFTIEKLSSRPYSLHGLLLDTCTNSLRIDQDLYSLLHTGGLCNTQTDFGNYIIDKTTVGGVITTLSTNVMAANRVLAPLKIPLVGSMSSSTALNNKEAYPYFARTVPPDNKQMHVIAEILKQNNWTYVSVVYSRETYGVSGTEELEKQARSMGVCVGLSVPISYPTNIEEAKGVVNQLVARDGANVVILATLEPRPILQAADELGVLNKFIWIGTDIWGTSSGTVQGFEQRITGSITISPRFTVVPLFDQYLSELTYQNRKNIPDEWFEEFYQMIHKCRLSDASIVLTQYTSLCTKLETITSAKLEMDKHFVHTTVAATYAAASAIQQAKNSHCSALPSFPDCFKDTNNMESLFQKLLETQYDVANGFHLNFTSERYWDVGYSVYNYVMDASGNYVYKKVGTVLRDGVVRLESYNSYKDAGFTSQCPLGGFCNCDSSIFYVAPQTQSVTSNRTRPEEPRNYLSYEESKLVTGQTVYTLRYNWPIWAIVTAVLTCVGLLIGIFVFVYFLISYPVRGGTTVLGFMMLFGILAIYATNFAFFIPASEVSCGARRFLMGVVYAIVFAALLVKAIDDWRFSGVEYNVRKYSGLTSTCSLFMCALGIVCVQLIIPVEWLILEHPSATLKGNNELNDWMWCNPIDKYDNALVMSMLLVIFLVLLTAIFAALAWDSDSNYFESRWIFVSCVCTAGCFLVWMVVTTNAGPPYRDAAVALSNFVNATALLICLPIRKLWLLIYLQRLEEKESLKSEEIEDTGADQYSQLYSNAGYENDVFTPEIRKPGSDIGF